MGCTLRALFRDATYRCRSRCALFPNRSARTPAAARGQAFPVVPCVHRVRTCGSGCKGWWWGVWGEGEGEGEGKGWGCMSLQRHVGHSLTCVVLRRVVACMCRCRAAAYVGAPITGVEAQSFADGETSVRFADDVEGEHVVRALLGLLVAPPLPCWGQHAYAVGSTLVLL
jgi:hypothetical protein